MADLHKSRLIGSSSRETGCDRSPGIPIPISRIVVLPPGNGRTQSPVVLLALCATPLADSPIEPSLSLSVVALPMWATLLLSSRDRFSAGVAGPFVRSSQPRLYVRRQSEGLTHIGRSLCVYSPDVQFKTTVNEEDAAVDVPPAVTYSLMSKRPSRETSEGVPPGTWSRRTGVLMRARGVPAEIDVPSVVISATITVLPSPVR